MDQRIAEETLPESKVDVLDSSFTMSGPLVGGHSHWRRRAEEVQVIVRLLCMASNVVALSFMVTAKEAAFISIYGFHLPLYSYWSLSQSFQYLGWVSAAAAAHSLLQLLISISRLLSKSSVIPSRTHAWIIFAGDQAFAYALMSAGSAASGVTNLNHTGIRLTTLPDFCKPLHKFCDHVAISIVFTFISCFFLATSAVQDEKQQRREDLKPLRKIKSSITEYRAPRRYIMSA